MFMVVLTSACPKSSCTSFGAAPLESRLLVNVCRSWWKWKPSSPGIFFEAVRQTMLTVLDDSKHPSGRSQTKVDLFVVLRQFLRPLQTVSERSSGRCKQRSSAGTPSLDRSPSVAILTWNANTEKNTAGSPCGAYIETPCKFEACRA